MNGQPEPQSSSNGGNGRRSPTDASFVVTNHRSKSGCCEVIVMKGELDFGTAHHLGNVLDRMMVVPEHIIADVSQLRFMDSTGLRLLLRASTLVEGRIWIKGPSRHLLRLFDLSGVADAFCFADDRKLAHQMMGKRSLVRQPSIESPKARAARPQSGP